MMLGVLQFFATLGLVASIIPDSLSAEEANCNTCAAAAAPGQNITHDTACLEGEGLAGCVSMPGESSTFNGCRYCEFPPYEDISCETSTCPGESGESSGVRVATGYDAPPYISNNATTGVVVDLLELLLQPRNLSYIQIPFEELQTAAQGFNDTYEIVAPVKDLPSDATSSFYFSNTFFNAYNVAITKSKVGRIKSIEEFADKKLFTWDGAWEDLGPKFRDMFAPNGTDHANLEQFPDQEKQVKQWMETKDGVLIIDSSIFAIYARELGVKTKKLSMSKLFGVTSFKAAFQNETMRDDFNAALDEACENGDYGQVLKDYSLPKKRIKDICEGEQGNLEGGEDDDDGDGEADEDQDDDDDDQDDDEDEDKDEDDDEDVEGEDNQSEDEDENENEED